MPLAGVGHDVQGGHDQAGAVADDADLAVELDVVEVLLLGLLLQRVGGLDVDEVGVAGLAEVRVVVQRDLAVQRDHAAVTDAGQRVDLDQRRVGLDEGVPQLDEDVGHGGDQVVGELRRRGDLAGLGVVDTDGRVDGHRARASGRSTASCSISMPPS